MYRPIALLWLFAASALGLWEGGLKVRFDLTFFGIGTKSFINLPRSVDAAIKEEWTLKTRHNLHDGYDSLSMYCPKDYTLCALFDDTGFIAGLQIAISEERFTNSTFDWSVQGFSYWTTDMDGEVLNFWTTQQYYISPETLATDPAARVAKRNSKLTLQDHCILVSGFNGNLYRISTNVSDITGPDSDFTKQACIPWMGQHYYYKTTKESECKDDTLFPWFPLVDSNQLIGLGLVMFGKHTSGDDATNYFEEPSRLAVSAIVPNGPECLYELADSPGIVTMHTYFIESPRRVSCLF